MDQYTVGVIRVLIKDLEDLSSNTERIYGSFAESYPQMLKEIGSSVSRAQELANQLQGEDQSLRQQEMIQKVRYTKRFIKKSAYIFNELQDKDDELLQVLNDNIQKIEQLKEHIGRIRSGSESLELISLNAMTVAIKAGSAGGAFSYITDDLKRLSAQTITSTEKLTEQGDRVQAVFARFRSNVERVEHLQDELFSDFDVKLERAFSDFYTQMKQVAKSMGLVNAKINMINEPLMNIMHEIQKQDIIRQSIDHVLMTLRELNMEISDQESFEEILDELTFCKALPDLAGTLLEDIQTQIKTSYTIFISNSRDIRVITEQTEDFYRQLTGIRPDDNNVQIFGEAPQLMKRLTERLSEPQSVKKRIAEESKDLLEELKLLEEEFLRASGLVHRFHNINIASKIEIAKQPILRVMENTVTEMVSLTNGIEDSIEEATKTIRRFIKKTKKAIRRYKDVFQEENEFLQTFTDEYMLQYGFFASIADEMNHLLSQYTLFTGGFITLFHESESHLEMMSTLVTAIDRIREELDQIKENAEGKEQAILEHLGKESWDIRNKKIQMVVEKFTILAHKQAAGDLAGFTVEDGTDEGEVTFF